MAIQAVVFDLDGTLLDTLRDLADSMNAVLAEWGLPTHPVERYRYLVGDGIRTLARRALPDDHQDEATIERCVAAMAAAYARRYKATTRPYEGIPELLEALTARGLKLAVFSNKPDEFTRRITAELLGAWAFAVVLGARDGVPVKPDPTGALAVAARLAVACRDILYVGDTATDMRCASAAGMIPVGAGWGFREAAELWAAGARAVVEAPGAVVGLLDS